MSDTGEELVAKKGHVMTDAELTAVVGQILEKQQQIVELLAKGQTAEQPKEKPRKTGGTNSLPYQLSSPVSCSPQLA
jgi:hypothetical protein